MTWRGGGSGDDDDDSDADDDDDAGDVHGKLVLLWYMFLYFSYSRASLVSSVSINAFSSNLSNFLFFSSGV